LLQWEQRADLTLSLGTSMCGMNSDRVFTTVAKKALKQHNQQRHGRESNNKQTGGEGGAALGGVIVSLQQTQFDSLSSLRIYARLDDVMWLLLQALLGMETPADTPYQPTLPAGSVVNDDVYLIPYSVEGALLLPTNGGSVVDNFKKALRSPATNSPTAASAHVAGRTTLDLRAGSRVRLTSGPHASDEGEVLGRNKEGHYRIQFMHRVDLTRIPRPFETVLGLWWVQAAVIAQ
jgi:hypothetical protein